MALTVYKYGFSEPVVEPPKPQGPSLLTLALIAGGLYWAWSKGWLKKLGSAGGSEGGQQQ